MAPKKSLKEIENEMKSFTVQFIDRESGQITSKGTGFVITKDGLIATCSHVIQDEKSQKEKPRPDSVQLIFAATNTEGCAEVVEEWWRPTEKGDIAIVKLKLAEQEKLPEGVKVASLSAMSESIGHRFWAFGYPERGERLGHGEIMTQIHDNAFEMRLRQLSESSSVTSGHSGAAIMDLETQYVVGMVVAIDPYDAQGRLGDNAFAVEVDEIAEICPEIKKILHPAVPKLTEEQEHAISALGFTLYTPDYFEENKSTEKDFEIWKKGFSFKIEAINGKLEYRRNQVIDEIEGMLESVYKLLIVGESGASKSTILMEIICDYVDEGYWVLYLTTQKISNAESLVEFLKGLLRSDKKVKVLVAVDNVHVPETAAIFYVIDRLASYNLCQNLRFILTARLPDFDQFIEHLDLGKIPETYVESIRRLNCEPYADVEFRFKLPVFSEEDIAGFIRKYGDSARLGEKYELKYKGGELSRGQIHKISKRIMEETKGNAVLVRFLVLGQGLQKDVEDRYDRYLGANSENKAKKIQTMLVCALLEIDDFPVTDELLEKMYLKDFADTLEGSMLQTRSGIWSTLHRKWDLWFLAFMFDRNHKTKFDETKKYLGNAIESVIMSKDDKATIAFVRALTTFDRYLYDFFNAEIERALATLSPVVPLEEVELKVRSFTKSESWNPSPQTVSELERVIGAGWLNQAARYFFDDSNPEKFIYYCNKAMEIDPTNTTYWRSKISFFMHLEKFDDALECYDRLIKISPNDAESWSGKGYLLAHLDKLDEALECYNEAIKIDSNHEYLARRALLKARKGNIEGAKADLEKVIDLGYDVEYLLGIAEHCEVIFKDKRFKALVLRSRRAKGFYSG